MQSRLTLFLMVAVAGLAIWSAVPTRDVRLPGVLRVAVATGPGEFQTSRALAPLCDYLGLSVRRSMRPVSVLPEQLRAELSEYDLALIPSSWAQSWEGSEVLAWGKVRASGGFRSRPFVVTRRDHDWVETASPRVIFGDRYTWAGYAGALDYLRERSFDATDEGQSIAFGHNMYDHSEAIAALVHGAFDIAIVREADMRAALDAGLLRREAFAFEAAGELGVDFALVAGPSLSGGAKQSIREAALNIESLRYDKLSLRVKAVLGAMGQLGLEGFGPTEPFPAIRP